MKVCDVCGCKNLKISNYCIHCGNRITEDNFCPNCHKLNNDTSKFCKYCQTQLKPVAIETFDDLFSDYNINLLADYNDQGKLTDKRYLDIINSVFEKAEYANIKGDTTKEKILSLCSIFARCAPKNREFDRGHNFGDIIRYDDRTEDAIQISTLIHELAHCLLFEVIASIVCDIFQVKRSSTIDSFVCFFLYDPFILIFNEYYASSVEGRFIPHGYQNYGSYIESIKSCSNDVFHDRGVIVENYLKSFIDDPTDKDVLDFLQEFANSFAFEIITLLEGLIKEDLMDDIKFQFRVDDVEKNNSSICNEIKDRLSLSQKNQVLMDFLVGYYILAFEPESLEELESYKIQIESDITLLS